MKMRLVQTNSQVWRWLVMLIIVSQSLVMAVRPEVVRAEEASPQFISCQPKITKEIIPNDPEFSNSYPKSFVTFGTSTYFVATTQTDGQELWRTDGTNSGTRLIKDIFPGAGSGVVSVFQKPELWSTNYGILFTATSDGIQNQLWRSDGTSVGTFPLRKDLSITQAYTVVNGSLYFFSFSSTAQSGLWKSDGTESGTQFISGVQPTKSLAVKNNKWIFSNDKLWSTDGTASGTIVLREAVNGDLGDIRESVVLNDILYFTTGSYFGASSNVGTALWRSDGTVAGTTRIAMLYPFGDSVTDGGTTIFYPRLTVVNNTLFFRAYDAQAGVELWATEGSTETTRRVKDIANGVTDSFPELLTNVNGTLFFVAYDTDHGYALWKSNGTEGDTLLIKDINPGIEPAFQPNGTYGAGIAVGKFLLFPVDDGVSGNELWRSDGTSAGTTLVKDIAAGAQSSWIMGLTNSNDSVYFVANDQIHGNEWWKSDGTTNGTTLLKDINVGSGHVYGAEFFSPNASQFRLAPVQGGFYFAASSREFGLEFWRSDGTTAGTQLVKDINPVHNMLVPDDPGSPSIASPTQLGQAGKSLFFQTSAAIERGWGTYRNSLWSSDGSESRTNKVWPNADNAYAYAKIVERTAMSNTTYFLVDGDQNDQLWKSDGSRTGTTVLFQNASESLAESFYGLSQTPDTLYFFSARSTSTKLWKLPTNQIEPTLVRTFTEDENAIYAYALPLGHIGSTFFFEMTALDGKRILWKSDGTANGTVLVKQLPTGLAGVHPVLVTSGGVLYFILSEYSPTPNDSVAQIHALWRSDGSEAGTYFVANVSGQSDLNFTEINGVLYFTNATNTTGLELWKSDGSAQGTMLVKDIAPGVYTSKPKYLTSVNGTLFFQADDGSKGAELWKSDGTTAGTQLVKDIFPGATGSLPSSLVATADGKAIFAASDGVSGMELWQSDGSTENTKLLYDLAPGIDNSNPSQLTLTNERLFLTADSPTAGNELWSVQLSSAGALVCDRSLVTTINSPLSIQHTDLAGTGATLTYQTLIEPQHGKLTNNGNGAYTYQPDLDFVGDDNFKIQVNDGQQSTTANVTIFVKSANPYYLSALASSSALPNVLLAIRQRGDARETSYHLSGEDPDVVYSLDGGVYWTALPRLRGSAVAAAETDAETFVWQRILGIGVAPRGDPAVPNRFLVDRWRSGDYGQIWAESQFNAYGLLPTPCGLTQIAASSVVATRIYAVYGCRSGYDTLYTSADAGVVWKALSPAGSNFRITPSPVAPARVYVSYLNIVSTLNPTRVWQQSDDFGATWVTRAFTDVVQLTPHPSNPNLLYGVSAAAGATNASGEKTTVATMQGVRSQDGGTSWSAWTGQPCPTDDAGDVQLLALPAPTETLLLRCPIGSLHRSTDGGATWEKLSASAGFGLFADNGVAGRVFWSRWDGLWGSTDAGTKWAKLTTDYQSANVYLPLLGR